MTMKDATRHIKMAFGDLASDSEVKRMLETREVPDFGDPICEMILGVLVGRLLRLGASPEAIGKHVEMTAKIIARAAAAQTVE